MLGRVRRISEHWVSTIPTQTPHAGSIEHPARTIFTTQQFLVIRREQARLMKERGTARRDLVETLILNISDTINSQLACALGKNDWLHQEVLGVGLEKHKPIVKTFQSVRPERTK